MIRVKEKWVVLERGILEVELIKFGDCWNISGEKELKKIIKFLVE